MNKIESKKISPRMQDVVDSYQKVKTPSPIPQGTVLFGKKKKG